MVLARVSAVVAVVGSVLIVIGSIGTWATVGSTSVGGVDGGRDGWITLVLALLAGGAAAGVLTPPSVARVMRWLVLPWALLALLVALIDIADISSTSSEFSNQFSDVVFTLSVGWGLWLVLAGSIIVSVAAVVLMIAPMPRPPHRAHAVPGPYVPGSFAPPGWQPQYPQQYQPQQQYPGQAYPPQPHPGQYPPQPYQGQPYPPQTQPPPAPAPPAWPTTGPAYPGSTEPESPVQSGGPAGPPPPPS